MDGNSRNLVTNIREIHGRHDDFVLDVMLKPRTEQNRNFEDLIRKCDILEGESEDL